MPREQEEAALEVRAGQRVRTLGKYRVIAELARGGMGIVYLALMRGPAAFSKLVVLKELKPELLEDPDLVAMFMDEARLAACLSHPNVVQTLEAGSEGNRRYIAMEYLDGQSLSRVLARARKNGVPLSLEFQGAVLCHALEGLAYAHDARDYAGEPLGIVHRDISPQNIFIGYDGQVKVLDFGIAKAKSALVDTRTGVLKGKVAYMAPEQANGAPVDARADLFAVGIVLWEAVTGRRFWSGTGTDVQILRALLRGDLDAGRDARVASMAEIPDDLRAIIAKATATDPAHRQAGAAELLKELLAALSKRGPPLPKAADIGRVVQELFTVDRAKLQVAVEGAVSFYRRPISGKYSISELTSLVGEPEHPSRNVGLDEFPDLPVLWHTVSIESSGPPVLTGSSPLPAARGPVKPLPARLSGRLVASFGATVLSGALAVAAWSWASGRPRAPAMSTMVTAAAPASASAVAESDPAPMMEKVRVVIRASPASARILLDRRFSFANPCVTTLPKDGSPHAVHVEADGYLARDESFDSSGDTSLIIALESHRAPDRAVARTAAAVVRSAAPAPTPAGPPGAALAQSAGLLVVAPAASPTGLPLRRINAINPYH